MRKQTFLVYFVILILGVVLFIIHNYGFVMSKIGNYFYTTNNLLKAQNYYEKAFENGYIKEKDRIIYLNSIINSPLDIIAQTKLEKFIEEGTEDTAYYNAKKFVSNYKDSILEIYPDNYIQNSTYNQKVMRWANFPITYWFENPQDAPDYYIEEVKKALNSWEKSTDYKIVFEENSNNPNITITFATEITNSEANSYVAAYVIPSISGNSLLNMNMKIFVKNPNDEYFTNNQIYNNALHETAHALGFMGHSNDKNNIMYLTRDTITQINNDRAELTEADINTIKLLYKIKPEVTNSQDDKAEFLPYLILGDDTENILIKEEEARTYIKKAPNVPAGYIDLAENYLFSKEYFKAIACLEKALRLAETDETKKIINYNLAVVYFHIENFGLAKMYVEKAKEYGEGVDTLQLEADICMKSKEFEKAIKLYKELLYKDSKNIDYVISLTNVYVMQKKYFEARKVLKNFIKNNPDERNNKRFQAYGILNLFL